MHLPVIVVHPVCAGLRVNKTPLFHMGSELTFLSSIFLSNRNMCMHLCMCVRASVCMGVYVLLCVCEGKRLLDQLSSTFAATCAPGIKFWAMRV